MSSSRPEHPAYGLLRPVTESASVLLCDNPGLMTLDGTNTWVLRGPRTDEMVIVDPGPIDDEHTARVAELGTVALVLISHRHEDHTGGIDKIVELTGAPVRSVGSGFLRGLGGPLTDGEVIDAAGLRITVLATPGHTADSVSFVLDDAVLTGDTVLGRGTTVIDNEDGSLGAYLESLRRLQGLGGRAVLPGHGPELENLREVAAGYLAHREQRLDQVRRALQWLGDDASARQIVEHVYTDVDEKLWDAAEWSVQAQLNYLRPLGFVHD
jgi:glyoxylase-like metal-dependent hydrolase (beta-lactamase superfamily II)